MKTIEPSPHGMAGDCIRAARGLTGDQQTVLQALSDGHDDTWGFNYRGFNYLAQATLMNRKRVRVVVRQLARKGLAGYAKGLFNEDGGVAGSGYAATRLGAVVAQIITDGDSDESN